VILLILAQPVSQIQFPVNTVSLPALSSTQTDAAEFGAYYQNMVQLVIFLSMPIVVFLGLFGDVVVNLVLGPQWVKAIPVFQVLAVGAFIEPLVHTTGPAMVAYGKTREYFRLGVVNSGSFIACIGMGSLWGTIGVACGYAFGMYIAFMACILYGLSHTPIKINAVVKKIGATSLCSVLAGLTICCFRWWIGWEIGFPLFLLFLAGGVMGYLVLWMMIPGGPEMLRGYLHYCKKLGKQ
jgi:PST family polysaccharide transporter